MRTDGAKKIKVSPTEHRKQSASRIELLRDEKITAKLSQMMDHSIETHRVKYTFVHTAREAISAFDSIKEWRMKEYSEDTICETKEEDQVSQVKRKRKWTEEETNEVERVLETKKLKIMKISEVRLTFKDNEILKDRSDKNILDKIRQLSK